MKRYTAKPKAGQIWDGELPAPNLAYAFSGGDGQETNPYIIATAADLAQLSANVRDSEVPAPGTSGLYQDQYFKLANDICLNEEPIDPAKVNTTWDAQNDYENGVVPDPDVTGYDGDVYQWFPIGGADTKHPYNTVASAAFYGNFDGDGYTIRNVFYNHSAGANAKHNSPRNEVGIFGSVGETGSVKNLNAEGGYIGGDASVGGIIGRTWGNITNCHNGNFVFAMGPNGTGGVVGASWKVIETVATGVRIVTPEVDGCSNSGTVISHYYKTTQGGAQVPSGAAGGVVGENENPVINSWNTGVVSSLYNAGGIVGSNQNATSQGVSVPPSVVNNCYNTGSVGIFAGEADAGASTDYGIPAANAQISGGIIGFQTGSCENVYNVGNITGTDAVGQIIGEMNTDDDQVNDFFYIFDGTTAVGNVKDGSYTVENTFEDDPDWKEELAGWLDNWVTSEEYSHWIQVGNRWPELDGSTFRRGR